MESVRFFVAGLPADTTEKELKYIFKDYGEVCAVDLKTKKNLVDEQDVKIIAFVTLKIDPNDVRYCLNDLNWKKIRGAKINVTQAKESFLERLKREREEAEAVASGNVVESEEAPSSLLLGNAENKRKTFAEDEELDEDDIAPSLLISKKRAASSMHNGRIVIQSFDAAPIHIIETKKAKKRLDEKSQTADQKRKQSLNKMKTDYQQKKSAIQAALTGTMKNSNAKKIRFSDSEDEGLTTTKTKIFGSDEEADDADDGLNLKPEHFSKKGERLAQMQSQQSLDPRFKIDANFVDDENDDDHDNDNDNADNAGEDDERNWQMGILEQVVGTKIDTSNTAQKAAKNKKMLHFDPSKEEHQKFIRTKPNEDAPAENATTKKKNKKKNVSEPQDEDDVDDSAHGNKSTSDVSKEVFYVVTDTLAQSLKTGNEGFSLLSMFGKADHLEERKDKLQQLSNEKILVNKLEPNKLNPFSHDSSSDSEDEVVKDTQTPQNQKKKNKICTESFFIPKNDVRLKEGAKFFHYDKEKINENYDEVRNRLKTIIKTKIAKTKKNLAAAGVKTRKRKH